MIYVETVERSVDWSMRIVEYRVILPTIVPQYQIGNLYMCAQRTRQESGGGEGIEILKNEPYEKEGEKGQFTHKVMHFKSRIPGAIRWALPDKYLHVHEISHNSFPHFHTLYDCPGMGKDLYLLVESQHIAYNAQEGCPQNALNLTEEELSRRVIVYLDIVNGKPLPEKPEWDMHGFVCPTAGVQNPLQTPNNTIDETQPPEWTNHYNGDMMICIKVVKFKFKWFGLQKMVENYALNTVFHNVFLDSHRALMRWAAEWFPMNLSDIRRLEDEVLAEQRGVKFDKDEDSEKK